MSCRVLAIDPGIKRIGWAVLSADPDEVCHRASGIIAAEDLSLGLVLELLAGHRPNVVAVEKPVARSFGALRNLVEVALQAGLIAGWCEVQATPVALVPSYDWRAWVTGAPNAKDAVIASAIEQQVKLLPKRSNPDIRDAIGLGLYAARQHTPGRRAA